MIKYVLKSIKNSKIISIMIVMQFICLFIALYNIFYYSNTVNNLSEKVEKVYSNRSIYRLVSDEEAPKEIDTAKVIEGINILSENKDYKFVLSAPEEFRVKIFNGYEKFMYEGCTEIFKAKNGEEFTMLNAFLVNKNALETFNVELDEGRYFKPEEFYQKEGILPLILGSGYKGIFNIGDKIEFCSQDNSFKEAQVIGILKEGESMPTKFDTFNVKFNANVSPNNYILDNSIVVPLNFNSADGFFMVSYSFFYNFIVMDKDLDINKKYSLLNEIEEYAEKNFEIKYVRKSYDNEITAELNSNKRFKDRAIKTTIIVVFFSTITMIVSILNFINDRKREFGVHMLSGASIKNIAYMIFLQILLLTLIGFILSMIVLKIYFRYFEIDKMLIADIGTRKLEIDIMCKLIIWGIAYSSVISILPLKKLLSLGIKDLLRRDD